MKSLILSLVILSSLAANGAENCSRICQGGHLKASVKSQLKKSYLQAVSKMGAHVLFSSEPVQGCAMKDLKADTRYGLCVLENGRMSADMTGRLIHDNLVKNLGRSECIPLVARSTMSYVLANLLTGNYDSHTGRKLQPSVGDVYQTLEWVTEAWTCGQN